MGDTEFVDNRNLSTLFDDVWTIYLKCDKGTYSSTDANMHKEILKCIEDLEKGVFMVNQLDLFGINEDIEEISTSDIRYLLLPALMGYFTENSSNLDDRLQCIEQADVYFRDYFRVCQLYSLTTTEAPIKFTSCDGTTIPGRSKSTNRVAEYKENKLRNARIEEFQNCDLKTLDDEIQREYYLLLVEQFLNIAKQSLQSFQMEFPILEHRNKLKKDKNYAADIQMQKLKLKEKKSTTPTFIITKDKRQKEVFGVGYPSVPIVTLDEYYDSKVASGEFPAVPSASEKRTTSGQGTVRRVEGGDAAAPPGDSEETKARKDEEIDTDNVEALEKARNWDEFKDDNRRGWGNRQNMG